MNPLDLSLENLYRAYYRCRRNKRNTANALRFEAEQEKNLLGLRSALLDRSYCPAPSVCFFSRRGHTSLCQHLDVKSKLAGGRCKVEWGGGLGLFGPRVHGAGGWSLLATRTFERSSLLRLGTEVEADDGSNETDEKCQHVRHRIFYGLPLHPSEQHRPECRQHHHGQQNEQPADRKNNVSFSYLPQACPAVQQRSMTCPSDP